MSRIRHLGERPSPGAFPHNNPNAAKLTDANGRELCAEDVIDDEAVAQLSQQDVGDILTCLEADAEDHGDGQPKRQQVGDCGTAATEQLPTRRHAQVYGGKERWMFEDERSSQGSCCDSDDEVGLGLPALAAKQAPVPSGTGKLGYRLSYDSSPQSDSSTEGEGEEEEGEGADGAEHNLTFEEMAGDGGLLSDRLEETEGAVSALEKVTQAQTALSSQVLMELQRVRNRQQKQSESMQKQLDSLQQEREVHSVASDTANKGQSTEPIPKVGDMSPRDMTNAEIDQLRLDTRVYFTTWASSRRHKEQACAIIGLQRELWTLFLNKTLHVDLKKQLDPVRKWDLYHLVKGSASFEVIRPASRIAKLCQTTLIDTAMTESALSFYPPANTVAIGDDVADCERCAPVQVPSASPLLTARDDSPAGKPPGAVRKRRNSAPENGTQPAAVTARTVSAQSLHAKQTPPMDVTSPTLRASSSVGYCTATPQPHVNVPRGTIRRVAQGPAADGRPNAIPCPHPLFCNDMDAAVEMLLTKKKLQEIQRAAFAGQRFA